MDCQLALCGVPCACGGANPSHVSKPGSTERGESVRTEVEVLLRRMEDVMEPGDEIRVGRTAAGFDVYLSRPIEVQRR